MSIHLQNSRCPTYRTPENCVLVTDPQDACCRVPSCEPIIPPTATPTPQGGNEPSPGTTQVPATDEHGSTLYPPVIPTLNPNATPTRVPAMIPTGVPGKIVGQIVKEPNSNTNDTFSKLCIPFSSSHCLCASGSVLVTAFILSLTYFVLLPLFE